MQQQYHACNGITKHATALSRMQGQYQAYNTSITHTTPTSMQCHSRSIRTWHNTLAVSRCNQANDNILLGISDCNRQVVGFKYSLLRLHVFN